MGYRAVEEGVRTGADIFRRGMRVKYIPLRVAVVVVLIAGYVREDLR